MVQEWSKQVSVERKSPKRYSIHMSGDQNMRESWLLMISKMFMSEIQSRNIRVCLSSPTQLSMESSLTCKIWNYCGAMCSTIWKYRQRNIQYCLQRLPWIPSPTGSRLLNFSSRDSNHQASSSRPNQFSVYMHKAKLLVSSWIVEMVCATALQYLKVFLLIQLSKELISVEEMSLITWCNSWDAVDTSCTQLLSSKS